MYLNAIGTFMPRPPDPARLEAIKAIRELIAEHGDVDGPRLARLRFPNVPAPTWYRWVSTTREEDRNLVEEAAAAIPHPARPPLPVTDEGRIATRRAIDFYRELEEMVEDARLLADYAVTMNDDGTRRIKNPQMLALSHRMRATNMTIALKHSEMVWNVERLEQMHDAITRAILQADSETAKRVFAALKDVHDRWSL
ncbi:hypothetical protein [Paraburkholderia sp. Cpub6]|uniref:hypothetical protein n=1 Tax=Paraburkholderia sp. Cpub6 TaxID=2723094 RepID=UPI0016107BF9|nr:hypothetical protein [Paraburkholderia sp. Cpub6]MBB5456770.1 hypothetical protein [Paraburkholderia sp. Cpub6]